MSPKKHSFLDANIFLRYLIWDDEAKALRCQALFQEFKGLRITDKSCILRALDAFAEKGVDFPDAYLAEVARTNKAHVYSYDRDLSALKARRLEA